MLTISAFKQTGKIDRVYSWRVGLPLPFENEGTQVVQRFFSVEVFAYGDELDYIRKNMSNIPQASNKKCVTWYGDNARFIAANL